VGFADEGDAFEEGFCGRGVRVVDAVDEDEAVLALGWVLEWVKTRW
jgi:hypothetical protein